MVGGQRKEERRNGDRIGATCSGEGIRGEGGKRGKDKRRRGEGNKGT